MAYTSNFSNVPAPADPYAYDNYLQEEERKRLEAEKPVTQTIKYNPDGTQEMVIKGSPTALSPENPNTPTVTGPAVPQAPQAMEAQPNFAQPAPQMPAMPEPGPAVQVAGPTQLPQTAPSQPQSQYVDNGPTQEEADFINAFHAGQTDPSKMAAIYSAGNAPDYIKNAARDQMQKSLIDTQEEKKAQEDIARVMASGNGSDFAKLLKRQGDEGSYVKAYLFGRLGLNDLARAEQQKLGAGNVWQGVIGQKGERAIINYDGNGLPISGYDEKGQQLTGDQLASFAAGASPMKGLTTHTQAFKDKTTGELYWQRSDGRIVNSQGGVYAGPTNNLYAYGIGSDIEMKGLIGLQATRIKLEGVKAEDRVRALEDVNKKRIAEGLAPFSTSDIGIDENGRFTTVGGGVSPTQVPQPAAAGITPPAAQTTVPVTTTPATTGAVNPQVETARRNVEAIQREIARLPANEGNSHRRQILEGELSANREQLQRLGGAPVTAPTAITTVPGAVPAGGSTAEIVRERETAQAVARQQQENYQTKFVPALNEKADQGSDIARVRKDQIEVLNRNPELVGLLNGQGTAADEVRNIIRDAVAGQDGAELSRRIAALDLNQTQKNALYEYAALQNKILPLTLKQNAGAGSISEAEHKINRDAAVDATRVPIYTAYSALTRDQFDKQLKQAERDFATNNRFTTEQQHSTAWSKQKKDYVESYDRIYKARAEYIAKYGSTPQAVVAAYKVYPVPQYNADTGRFEYLGESAKAARPPLSSFR